jgi:hypothetical protein
MGSRGGMGSKPWYEGFARLSRTTMALEGAKAPISREGLTG